MLRHRGVFHHIGIGNAYAGWRVAMLIDGLNIENFYTRPGGFPQKPRAPCQCTGLLAGQHPFARRSA